MAGSQSRRSPLILVTNDDGIDSPGIRALIGSMDTLGEVVVVAPLLEQSGMSHAISVFDPLCARPYHFQEELSHIRALGIMGTPADCIKLALHSLLHRTPDLVVSGINRGANTAVNVLYSGTVSAATESCIQGIDSIAFSLCSKESSDYGPAAKYAKAIAGEVLEGHLPRGIVLNVNVPAMPYDSIQGVEVTRLAHSKWKEDFIARVDPLDRPYFWYTGNLINMDNDADTDLGAIDRGYVSMTPIQYDLTAYDCLDELNTRFGRSKGENSPPLGE